MTSPLANIHARLPVAFTHGQNRKYLARWRTSASPAWATPIRGWSPSASTSSTPPTSTTSRNRLSWPRAWRACPAAYRSARCWRPGRRRLHPRQPWHPFGGGPLVCAASLTVLDAQESENLLANAHTLGSHLQERLTAAELAGLPGVAEVRGRGLTLGIELTRPCGVLTLRALKAGLLINVTRDRVIRLLLPPLILSRAKADQLVAILAPLIRQFLAEHP